MAAKHRTEENHQAIPGLPDDADWCNECREPCAGRGKGRCSGCGGEEPDEQVPASQIQPEVHPPAVRTAEPPDAPTA